MPAVAPARRAALRRRLLAWYDASRRDFPWLSEAMLQQTQVARVIPYYLRFCERFPTLEALARHGGLPASLEALRSLPGFGPYTAGAVASIAFGIPAPAVDGNVARLLTRLFAIEGPPESAATRGRLQAVAEGLLRPERPGDWTQALIELGATCCVKPVPRCPRCPVATLCEARRAGRELELPPALPGGPAPVTRWRRRLGEALGARLGVAFRVGGELASVERTLTHRELTLVAWEVTSKGPLEGPGLRWATPLEVAALGTGSAVEALLAHLPTRTDSAKGLKK